MATKKYEINPEKCPCPDTIPPEVWEAFLMFFENKGPEEGQKTWKNYLAVKKTYKQDDQFNFLKDAEGNFIKE